MSGNGPLGGMGPWVGWRTFLGKFIGIQVD